VGGNKNNRGDTAHECPPVTTGLLSCRS